MKTRSNSKKRRMFILRLKHWILCKINHDAPDYGRTCYMLSHAATATWLWEDMLHLTSCCYNHLITEGQVTCYLMLIHPPDYRRMENTWHIMLPHPPDYGRTTYISPPLIRLPIYTFLLFMHLGQIWPCLSSDE